MQVLTRLIPHVEPKDSVMGEEVKLWHLSIIQFCVGK